MVSNVMFPIDDLKGNKKSFNRLKTKSLITAVTKDTTVLNDKMSYLILHYIDGRLRSRQSSYTDCIKLVTLVNVLKSVNMDGSLSIMINLITNLYTTILKLSTDINSIYKTEYRRYYDTSTINKDNIVMAFKLLKQLNKAVGKLESNEFYKSLTKPAEEVEDEE